MLARARPVAHELEESGRRLDLPCSPPPPKLGQSPWLESDVIKHVPKPPPAPPPKPPPKTVSPPVPPPKAKATIAWDRTDGAVGASFDSPSFDSLDEELPFWAEPDQHAFDFRHKGAVLKWEVGLVVPNGQPQPDPQTAKLPLLIYFAGLNSRGGIKDANLPKFQMQATEPFVVVAPIRHKGRWWFIDTEKEPAGFIEGNYMPDLVETFVEWIRSLAGDASIDRDWISILGYSAGAYAVTEVVNANRDIQFAVALVGGVHGHSQSDFRDVPEKLQNDNVLIKWKAYLERIASHTHPPREFLVVHHPEDEMCPWRYSEELCRAFDARRRELGASPMQVDLIINMPKSKKNKSNHSYHDKAILRPTFFAKLFPRGEAKGVYNKEEGMYKRVQLQRSASPQVPPPTEMQERRRSMVSEAKFLDKPEGGAEMMLLGEPAFTEAELDKLAGLLGPSTPAPKILRYHPKGLVADTEALPKRARLKSDLEDRRDSYRQREPEPEPRRVAAAPRDSVNSATAREWLDNGKRGKEMYESSDHEVGFDNSLPDASYGKESDLVLQVRSQSLLSRCGRSTSGGSSRCASSQEEGRFEPARSSTRSWSAANRVVLSTSSSPRGASAPADSKLSASRQSITSSSSTNAAARRESLPSAPALEGQGDRSNLMCANPSCWFLVHPDPVFGGYCCRKCHWRLDTGSKCKKKHGTLCATKEAPAGAQRAKSIPPDSPMTM